MRGNRLPSFLLVTRPDLPTARFYRVEVDYNLFGEYSVVREWGPCRGRGTRMLTWFSNLRDACLAAERWQHRARRRGYCAG